LPIRRLHAWIVDNGIGEVVQLLFQLRADRCCGKNALIGGTGQCEKQGMAGKVKRARRMQTGEYNPSWCD